MRISDWSSDVCSSDLYRFGYTKVEIDEPAILSPATQPQDIFDSSTNHVAWARPGARPGDLPFGWHVSGGSDRKSVVQGTRVSVRVALGGRRRINNTHTLAL